MSTKQAETNDVNGSRFADQGPSSGSCSRQWNIGRHYANPVISKQRKWSSQENKSVMECYLLSEPKVSSYRKCMLSLWLNKGMFWVSEQRLVDQVNTELEIEELEKNSANNDSYKKDERSADDTGSKLGEEVRYNLTAILTVLRKNRLSLLKK